MRCGICKKDSNDVQLFDGVFDEEMINICEYCAENEGIPLIKRPSEDQLEKVDKKSSVRERMERLSGPIKTTQISEDQFNVQRNIAKLRLPEKKQYHEDLFDNYYWTVNISRRRNKISPKQLAEKIGVEEEVIKGIERGKIPKNFEEIFIKLETYLGVKLIKNPEKIVHFTRTKKEEKEVLEEVKRKINEDFKYEKKESPKYIEKEIKRHDKEKINKNYGREFDFSIRENLQNVTLNDLVEMKRQRELREARKREKIREDVMFGDDLDIEEHDL